MSFRDENRLSFTILLGGSNFRVLVHQFCNLNVKKNIFIWLNAQFQQCEIHITGVGTFAEM